MGEKRPHVLGVDDAPFHKDHDSEVDIVGVVMEGGTVVEGVATTTFSVDGANATGFFVDWISDLKWKPTLDLIVFGGITIAGLGILDLPRIADRLAVPTAAATRHSTSDSDLDRALRTAGLEDRLHILDRTPVSRRTEDGLHLASAGAASAEVDRMIRATLNKASLPEPLRVAHLVAAAISRGSSRGRV
jgi:endonuclease V-like protein UPF0215 family